MSKDTPISELAGVGKETAAKFHELDLVTAGDLLNDFPFRYDDLRFPTPAALLAARGEASEENAVGRVVRVRERRARHLAIVEAEIEDDSGTFVAK
ncbi:MAG: hypothetical protein ACYCX6_11350, partial [Vulcanimicrobiaceae bacterium]